MMFALAADIRPIAIIDGRNRNGKIEPFYLRLSLESTEECVAMYFRLQADQKWQPAFDADGKYPGELDGPYQLWRTYPSDWQDHTTLPTFDNHLEDIYGEHDRECEIYRSRVMCLEDTPEFVQQEVSECE